jgi:CHASE2 domain-containing sensor protein
MFGLQAFAPGYDYCYAMNVGASLMLGWTLLLFWAARRPVERAGVLLLTAIVVFGLMLAGVTAVFSGFVLLQNMLPVFVLQLCVISLFLISYLKVSRLCPGSRHE